ncbi:MAG: methyltransferase domain-containing protein [Anaerolineae bacterium]|nr:methyltransferase domain-containing protein [Anaerolineae bacterium]
MNEPALAAVAEAFSRKARVYDAYGESNPIVEWSRKQARLSLLRRLKPQDAILELNAGTGADAAHFVSQGFRVHATELADGMLEQLKAKVKQLNQNERFTFQQCSFTNLDSVQGGPYDALFSNFGGLNCIPTLELMTEGLPRLLKPGAWVVLVLLAKICPWEIAQLLRGHWAAATRRLRPGGVLANVEGIQFKTYYFTPRQVQNTFPPSFQFVSLQSLCLFCPPSYLEKFSKKYPKLTANLMRLDERLNDKWPLNSWGDFFILTMQYQP